MSSEAGRVMEQHQLRAAAVSKSLHTVMITCVLVLRVPTKLFQATPFHDQGYCQSGLLLTEVAIALM